MKRAAEPSYLAAASEALRAVAEIDDIWNRMGGFHVCTICLQSRVTGHATTCQLGRFLRRHRRRIQRIQCLRIEQEAQR